MRSTKIKFIKQPYRSKKCGQTCLAMILDRPVDVICKEMNKYRTTDLYKDVAEKLIREGYEVKKVRRGAAFEDVPNNSVLRIQFPSGNGHFVIKHDGKYYDPATGIVEDYKDTYRTVTAYFTFKKVKDEK